jgi:hypothetical protein
MVRALDAANRVGGPKAIPANLGYLPPVKFDALHALKVRRRETRLGWWDSAVILDPPSPSGMSPVEPSLQSASIAAKNSTTRMALIQFAFGETIPFDLLHQQTSIR